MKVTICTLGIGGWYPQGVLRLYQCLREFHSIELATIQNNATTIVSNSVADFRLNAFINELPPGAPENVIEDGYDYTAYCAKPFVLLDAMNSGADIAIWIDAAFVPLRRLDPLIEHIAERGYYLCKNGAWVGEWASDRCLDAMDESREELMRVQEVSSYCVGMRKDYLDVVKLWAHYAADRITFPGRHTASMWLDEQKNLISSAKWMMLNRKNPGFVSDDPRVKGHRHDQTVLSILAHRLGFHELTERPKFTSYQGYSTAETVLEHRGM